MSEQLPNPEAQESAARAWVEKLYAAAGLDLASNSENLSEAARVIRGAVKALDEEYENDFRQPQKAGPQRDRNELNNLYTLFTPHSLEILRQVSMNQAELDDLGNQYAWRLAKLWSEGRLASAFANVEVGWTKIQRLYEALTEIQANPGQDHSILWIDVNNILARLGKVLIDQDTNGVLSWNELTA